MIPRCHCFIITRVASVGRGVQHGHFFADTGSQPISAHVDKLDKVICRRCHWARHIIYLMALNESGFRPPLYTYRLNWARRTSWWWWDDWDDTVLQTQDSKFEPWRSEAEHAISRSRRLPTILTFTRRWGRFFFFCLFQTAETGNRTPLLGPPPLMALKMGLKRIFRGNSFRVCTTSNPAFSIFLGMKQICSKPSTS